ncbi:MAG TPA: hypothetical protein VK721_05960 [Solirubrobacteraceae bacterium]|jgi:hypothetical protein|nr:hypothetical protein [Solirubrobacteraceae bacterium]
MEPLFKSLVIQLAPQPRQMPPAPLDQNDLQQIFSEIRRTYPYQGFAFTPDDRGAIFQNGPEDSVELRPAQIQIRAKLDGPEPLVAETAERKIMTILRSASSRLDMEIFLQCGIQLVALAAVPGEPPDAKAFVSETLMRDVGQTEVLGKRWFGGGIRYRSLKEDQSGEDSITIEPYIEDNTLIYLDYQKARVAATGPITLEKVSGWIGEAFDFVSGPTMQLLSA